MIDELSEIALEAIEQAAGEAARVAILSRLEHEAALIRETQRLREEAEQMKKTAIRNYVITGIASFTVGLVVGIFIVK